MHHWLRGLFFDTPDGGGSGGGAGDADRGEDKGGGDDSEFVVESASSKDAFETPPADTTETAQAAGATGDADPGAEAEGETDAGETKPGDASSVESVGRNQSGQFTARQAAKPAGSGKKKETLKERTVTVQKQLDTLTFTKHQTQREHDEIVRRRDAAKAELEDLERKKAALGSGAPADAKAAAATTTDADAMPDPPDYRKFDTDEAYEAAMATYRKDVTAWNRKQQEGIEKRITEGVENRFKSVDSEAQARETESTVVRTLDKVRKDRADWGERAETLKDIRSSWYDPTKHGQNQTPFLTDVSGSLLAMGKEEGAELLYWLGEDPDRAQALADLLPSRPLRDAIVHAPSPKALLEHFATDEGRATFENLKRMHPISMMQAVGALSVQLGDASSGSSPAVKPITGARPSARPPAGTPGARNAGGAPAQSGNFDAWMAAEDEKERKQKLRAAGVTA